MNDTVKRDKLLSQDINEVSVVHLAEIHSARGDESLFLLVSTAEQEEDESCFGDKPTIIHTRIQFAPG